MSTDQTQPEQLQMEQTEQRRRYAVVLFAKYNAELQRPSVEELTRFFNQYGVVDHINAPENTNFAFVFMASLSTPNTYQRTRATLSDIIRGMTPSTRFHIAVATNRNRTPSTNLNMMQEAHVSQPQYHQQQYVQHQPRQQYAQRQQAIVSGQEYVPRQPYVARQPYVPRQPYVGRQPYVARQPGVQRASIFRHETNQ